MESCSRMWTGVLAFVVLVAVVQAQPNGEKLASCCTQVSLKEITEPILGYLVQQKNLPCVQAVIFQTASGLFCRYLRAPWVRAKIFAFETAKADAVTSSALTTSPKSLLRIITSSTAPPSSSTSSTTTTAPPSSSTSSTTTTAPPSSFPSSTAPHSSSFTSSSSSSFPSTSETPAATTQ